MWIIMIMQDKESLENDDLFNSEDWIESDRNGNPLVFKSQDEASDFQEENGIDGRVVEVPTY